MFRLHSQTICSAALALLWSITALPNDMDEVVGNKVMRTALIALPHKIQMEDSLEPPATYSRKMLSSLIQSHPELSETFERISLDTDTKDYIVQRSRSIDCLLDKTLALPNPPETLIVLASGFDARPLRYRNRFHQVYEVDLPPVIRKKQAIYDATGLAYDHVLIPGDITHTDWAESVPRKNVVITLEGILPFLDEEQAQAVLLNIATLFRNSHIIVETFPEYMIPSSRLSILGAIARWLLSSQEDASEAIALLRSGSSVLKSDALHEWAPHLPTNRIVYQEHLSPFDNISSWKLKIPRVLGLETPRVTWLKVN